MPRGNAQFDFDTAIIGAGPAGLSAAIVLGRACRRVVVFDHGRPRNDAALAVHCFLGSEGAAPHELRRTGRRVAADYGVHFVDAEVIETCRLPGQNENLNGFELQTRERSFVARTLLLCTGVIDELPQIANIRDFYGRSVHHCPYCDGWEHRGQKLVAFGEETESVVKLAISLRGWSQDITACTNGRELSHDDRASVDRNRVALREERVTALTGQDGVLDEVVFESGPPLACDAMFFSSGQFQHSPLTTQLGCEWDERGMVRTGKRQSTGVNGLFLAGDADGEVQFAIVAAAEGAVAGVAINHVLEEDDKK